MAQPQRVGGPDRARQLLDELDVRRPVERVRHEQLRLARYAVDEHRQRAAPQRRPPHPQRGAVLRRGLLDVGYDEAGVVHRRAADPCRYDGHQGTVAARVRRSSSITRLALQDQPRVVRWDYYDGTTRAEERPLTSLPDPMDWLANGVPLTLI